MNEIFILSCISIQITLKFGIDLTEFNFILKGLKLVIKKILITH